MRKSTNGIAMTAKRGMSTFYDSRQLLRRIGTIAMAAGLGVVSMYAQDIDTEDEPDDKKIHFAKTSNDSLVYNILNKDRSKNINELPVPHFAIHTANRKFVMTIGAKVNPIIGADMGSDLYKMEGAGINFVPSQIRVPSVGGRKADFFINALNADIDFQVVGFGNTKNQITGYIKLSTGGNNNSIHLSKAYVTWRGLTAGLKHSLFQDEEAIPPTIDPQGPNGQVNVTVNEIGYISPSLKGVRLGIGLDMPEYHTSRGIYLGKDYRTWNSIDIEGKPVCDPDYYSFQAPDIPMFVEYAKGMNRVKLAGIIRPLIYRDMLCNSRKATVGWGLSLSGNVRPIDNLTFYLQATYGKGIGNYIQDLAGIPVSYVPDDRHPGRMTPTPMMGWSAGVSYDINPKWQINVMASQARMWNVSTYAENEADADTSINNYRYGYYGAANVFYNISSYFQLGLEYLYGYRSTWHHGSGHDNRLQFQVQFSL